MKCCMFCWNLAKIALKRYYFLQDWKKAKKRPNGQIIFISKKLFQKRPNGNPAGQCHQISKRGKETPYLSVIFVNLRHSIRSRFQYSCRFRFNCCCRLVWSGWGSSQDWFGSLFIGLRRFVVVNEGGRSKSKLKMFDCVAASVFAMFDLIASRDFKFEAPVKDNIWIEL